jgi:hypothetical protein
MLFSQPIKFREDLVEVSHYFARRRLAGAGREIDNVREQDRHLVKMIGDDLVGIVLQS